MQAECLEYYVTSSLPTYDVPIRAVARSNAWVYGRSIAEFTGSNPAEGLFLVSVVWAGIGFCV